MKGFILKAVLIILISSSAYAKVFELSVSGGIQSGKVSEFVYKNDYVLSRLDWNENIAPFISLSGRVDVFHSILDFSIFSAIPVKSGTIEDFDWLGEDKSRYTQYSSHDLYLTKHFNLEAKAGYEFSFYNFTVLPQIGIHYRNQKFEGVDGYLQYSFGNYFTESLSKTQIKGNCISYEQGILFPFISLEASYSFCKNWKAKLFGKFYPYVKIDAIDNHFIKLVQYNDFMTNGLGFSVGTEIQFKQFALFFEYEFLKCSTGKTTSRNIGVNSSLSSSQTVPGAESSVFTFSLIYRI